VIRTGVVLQIMQSLELIVKMTPRRRKRSAYGYRKASALDTQVDEGQTVGKQSVDNIAVESRRALSLTKLDSGVAFKAETALRTHLPSQSLADVRRIRAAPRRRIGPG